MAQDSDADDASEGHDDDLNDDMDEHGAMACATIHVFAMARVHVSVSR